MESENVPLWAVGIAFVVVAVLREIAPHVWKLLRGWWRERRKDRDEEALKERTAAQVVRDEAAALRGELRAMISELKEKLAAVEKEKAQRIEALEREIRELQNRISHANEIIRDWQLKHAAATAEVARLVHELDEMREECSRLQTVVNEMKSSLRADELREAIRRLSDEKP